MDFLIHLDGLNGSCIEYMPFLRDLRGKSFYVKNLISVAGFGAQSSYLTGTYPNVHGYFAAFFYDPKNSPFKQLRFVAKVFNRLPEKLTNYLRAFIYKTTRMNSYYIPLELLHNFNFKIGGERFPQVKQSVPTLFDILKSKNKKFKVFRRTFEKGQFDLAYILIYETDTWGHIFGPYSDKFKDMLKEVDAQVKRILECADEKANIVVFSEHGMAPVKRYVDIYSKLEYRDYTYFLDSTIARFWFKNPKVREKTCEIISEIKCGCVLTEEEKVEHKINFNHNRYGDLIFWLHEGCVFSPDFFHANNVRVRGMHGYLNPTHHGFLIINSREIKSGVIEKAELIDIFPTMLRLMDLPIPATNQGKCLI